MPQAPARIPERHLDPTLATRPTRPAMILSPRSPLSILVGSCIGARRAAEVTALLRVHARLDRFEGSGRVSRDQVAMALAMALLDDVGRRVPMARAYMGDALADGHRLVFDHGALRTVDAPSGALPRGRHAIARVLEALGYEHAETYPLDRLSMTGFVYRHQDLPADLPQFFVSELHADRFSPEFQAAVDRVIGASVDPLTAGAVARLEVLASEGSLPLDDALSLLPALAACFDRHHPEPRLEDYERLREESAEMAWIATEGAAFNHATDRVSDVEAVAEEQRRLGRPMKDSIEVSGSGRVLQTAFRAATVTRLFVGSEGRMVAHDVPGSFHEFIQRNTLADGQLDLAFDASNAQGIFKMTDAAGSAGERS